MELGWEASGELGHMQLVGVWQGVEDFWSGDSVCGRLHSFQGIIPLSLTLTGLFLIHSSSGLVKLKGQRPSIEGQVMVGGCWGGGVEGG